MTSSMTGTESTEMLPMSRQLIMGDVDTEDDPLARASCWTRLKQAVLSRLRWIPAVLALDAEHSVRASFGATVCGHPKMIAGQVFTPVAIGSMLARVSQNPGILQVMQALAVPEAHTDMFIYQIRATVGREGLSYRDVLLKLLKEHDGPALALGLYRLLTLEEAEQEDDPPAGYVMTNPKADALVRASDLLYVVGPTAWGRRMYQEGVLLNCSQEHKSRLSEVNLKGAFNFDLSLFEDTNDSDEGSAISA